MGNLAGINAQLAQLTQDNRLAKSRVKANDIFLAPANEKIDRPGFDDI
jgi:outer membrane murein-binding lipoprotein Lpp